MNKSATGADLKIAPDHPAQILHDRDAALIRDDGKDLGSVRYAANILWAHETNNGVSFVALDNDARERVHKTLDAYKDRTNLITTLGTLEDVVAAVNNLLGLNQ